MRGDVSGESGPGLSNTLTFSVAEAAEQLGKSEEWVKRAASRGDIPSRKIGMTRRFTQADIDEYLERCRQGAADPWARSPRSEARRRRSA